MAARRRHRGTTSSWPDSDEDGDPPRRISPSYFQPLVRRRKRAAAGSASEEVISVSSSPTVSCAMAKSKREKKQEALKRARQWHDNRKKGHIATAGKKQYVVNLDSPPPSQKSAGGRQPTSRSAKMTKEERQEARDRAKQWYERRPKRETDASDEEVISLSSTSSSSPHTSISSRGSPAAATGEEVNASSSPSNLIPHAINQSHIHSSIARSSATVGMGAFTQREMQQTHPNAAARSFGDVVGGREPQSEVTQQWACPRCTLLNPRHQSRCGACYHMHSFRRREHARVYDVNMDGDFVLEGQHGDRRSASISIQTFASSSMPAETLPAEQGTTSGVTLPFAMSGATHEALAREMLSRGTSGGGSWVRPRDYRSSLFFGGGLDHSSMAGYFEAQQPISMRHRISGRSFQQLPGSRESLSDMSYETLLEMFGDGSENRGAGSRDIESLPVRKIGDPQKELPEGKRECSICLEEFCRGDERTSLPCLHGFHSACVNRWLSSSGTCPVCKTSVKVAA